MVALQDIRCGVAGWSYPDWEGYVYPAGVRDHLGYLLRYVDMIEINSTFYRPPQAGYAARWAAAAQRKPGFFFAAKLHQEITHDERLTADMTAQLRAGLEPLRAGGVLRHLLAQFRYDFNDTPARREHLRRIREAFGDLAWIVVELRHRSWQAEEALEFLRQLGVSVANLDYPLGRDSFDLPVCTVGEHAYFRLHGRNRTAWFDREAGRDETYNYYYPAAEREGLKERAEKIAVRSASLTVVANNHWHGQELANALQLKSMFSGEKTAVPPLLLAHYPELKAIDTASA